MKCKHLADQNKQLSNELKSCERERDGALARIVGLEGELKSTKVSLDLMVRSVHKCCRFVATSRMSRKLISSYRRPAHD